AGVASMPLWAGSNAPLGIAVDATRVYWVLEDAVGMVLSVPVDGGATTTIASPQETDLGITIDATRIYWATGNKGGQIVSAPLGGGALTTLVCIDETPFALAGDARNLYWTTREGSVMQIPKP